MTINSIIEFFKGKKSYVIGALMITLGYLQGDQNLVLEGIGVITLRAGIAKI